MDEQPKIPSAALSDKEKLQEEADKAAVEAHIQQMADEMEGH